MEKERAANARLVFSFINDRTLYAKQTLETWVRVSIPYSTEAGVFCQHWQPLCSVSTYTAAADRYTTDTE